MVLLAIRLYFFRSSLKEIFWGMLRPQCYRSRNNFPLQPLQQCHTAKMGTIKDRNGMDLTEADGKKKRQEYTEELYKKDLHDPDNHDGVFT